jgi:hypothetical protein
MAVLYNAGRPALKNFVAALTVFVTDGEQTGETGETGVFANTAYRCRRLCCALARYPGIWHTGGKDLTVFGAATTSRLRAVFFVCWLARAKLLRNDEISSSENGSHLAF